MYKIQYQWSNRLPLAYFNDYDVAKEAHSKLKQRYPNAIIELVPVELTTSIQEFMDNTNGKIHEYESYEHIKKEEWGK